MSRSPYSTPVSNEPAFRPASYLLEDRRQIFGRDRAAIGAARQRGQHAAGTGGFLGRLGRPAREDALAARRIAGPGGIERAGEVHVIDLRQAVHVLQVVVALVRLQRFVRFGVVAPHERDAHGARAGLHLHPRLEPLVDRVGGLRHVLVRRRVVRFAADLRREHTLAVDRNLELVSELEPGHVADDVAQQHHAQLVLGVLREGVGERQAAAGAERQAVHVILLRIIGRHAEGQAHDARVGAHSEAAHAPRGAEILLEQRRRDAQHARDVVETEALVVGRQQGRGVEVQIEQVADRVAVLGAVQPVRRLGPRVDSGCGPAIEHAFERGGKGVERRGVGPRHALRRHHAAVQLLQHFLPELCVEDAGGRVFVLQRQAAGLQPIAVAAHAVLLHQRAVGGGRGAALEDRTGGGAACRAAAGAAEDAAA